MSKDDDPYGSTWSETKKILGVLLALPKLSECLLVILDIYYRKEKDIAKVIDKPFPDKLS